MPRAWASRMQKVGQLEWLIGALPMVSPYGFTHTMLAQRRHLSQPFRAPKMNILMTKIESHDLLWPSLRYHIWFYILAVKAVSSSTGFKWRGTRFFKCHRLCSHVLELTYVLFISAVTFVSGCWQLLFTPSGLRSSQRIHSMNHLRCFVSTREPKPWPCCCLSWMLFAYTPTQFFSYECSGSYFFSCVCVCARAHMHAHMLHKPRLSSAFHYSTSLSFPFSFLLLSFQWIQLSSLRCLSNKLVPSTALEWISLIISFRLLLCLKTWGQGRQEGRNVNLQGVSFVWRECCLGGAKKLPLDVLTDT